MKNNILSKNYKKIVIYDEETNKILEDYCNRKNKTIVEGVRDGINYLKEK